MNSVMLACALSLNSGHSHSQHARIAHYAHLYTQSDQCACRLPYLAILMNNDNMMISLGPDATLSYIDEYHCILTLSC